MKLVVLGGTGRIGRQVVSRALAHGHTVVAVSRRPRAMAMTHQKLTTAAADVLDPDSLCGPLASASAVIFAVGLPGRSSTVVRSVGIVQVAKVMHDSGVSRLVAVSPSAAIISPRAPLTRKLWLRYFVHKAYRNPFLDAERMEDELRHSKLDWSVIRGSRLRDGPPTGRYQVVPDGLVSRESPVSMDDFADYVVTHTADPTAHQDIVTVTGGG
jgi:putative NADH-flavin reductase